MNFSLMEFLSCVVLTVYDFCNSYDGEKAMTIREWMILFSDFINRRY